MHSSRRGAALQPASGGVEAGEGRAGRVGGDDGHVNLAAQGGVGQLGAADVVSHARELVAAANAGTSRQSRDLLGRRSLHHKCTQLWLTLWQSHGTMRRRSACRSEGHMCSCLLAGRSSVPSLMCRLTGRVHGLSAASPLSRVATGSTKWAMRYFSSVSVANPTAMYECHPYASARRCDSSSFGVKLTCGTEAHLWLPCCEDTAANELLGTGKDSDAEDECCTDLAKRCVSGEVATNVKCEVNVVWGVGGPVVADALSARAIVTWVDAIMA